MIHMDRIADDVVKGPTTKEEASFSHHHRRIDARAKGPSEKRAI
jgi:hypothetical protein